MKKFEQGMTLMPGESAEIELELSIAKDRLGAFREIKMVDVSAETFGKYQYCSGGPDGLYYADCDFIGGCGVGKLKRGALPSPWQHTEADIERARRMHEEAARKAERAKLSFWRRLFS